MFLIRRADVAQSGKSAPTLLYGYGGFNISLTPDFSATRLAWLEQGGAVALANLRGGREYGASWHDAGRLLNKQNVFDRSEEHTSELQSLMRISYAGFSLKQKTTTIT